MIQHDDDVVVGVRGYHFGGGFVSIHLYYCIILIFYLNMITYIYSVAFIG